MISPYDHITNLRSIKETKQCDEDGCNKQAIRVAYYNGKNNEHEFMAKFYCCEEHAKIMLNNCKEFK